MADPNDTPYPPDPEKYRLRLRLLKAANTIADKEQAERIQRNEVPLTDWQRYHRVHELLLEGLSEAAVSDATG
jgi:hypothetical protein